MSIRLRHLVTAIVIGGIYFSGGFELIDDRIGDARFMALRRAPSSNIAIVAIDARSLEELDTWPWPRGYHATVLENLVAAGAERVAFDLDFSSRSDPDEDAAFSGALATAGGRAVLPIFRQWQPGDGGSGGRLIESVPLAEFARHATLASINIRPERSGLVRRYTPHEAVRLDGASSMALALAGSADSVSRDPFYLDFGISVDSMIRISYIDILTGMFDPRLIEGKAVIVGGTAVELGDQVAVPVHSSLPGPVLQALAYESIASGRTLSRLAPPFVFLLVLGAVLLLGIRLSSSGWKVGLVHVALASVALFALSLMVQGVAGVMIDMAPVAIGLGATWALELMWVFERQRGRLRLQAGRRRNVATRMRHVVEHSLDAIITINEDGRIETFNSAASRIFGRSEAEVVGGHVDRIIEGVLTDADAHGLVEGTGLRRDGSAFVIEMSITSFMFGQKCLRVVFVRDITDRKRQERALRHQATHDALTDLPNRFLLRKRVEETLGQARDHGEPVAFLILDLDRFKEVNDTLGHQVGDLLLQRIGRRLKGPLRVEDTIARLGGDEFAILLPGADRERAKVTAELLIDALRQPFDVESLSLQVDTSIGVAMFPEHGTEANVLIQRADVAMYTAKKVRNVVSFYSPENDFNSLRHLTLKGDLREAAEKDHFEVWFQPKVSGVDGVVAGVEALIRWPHPEHGMLPPAEFIPLAEHTGLIKPITLWVLEAALKRCAAWREMGIDLSISVNCSARNLLDEELPNSVAMLLQRYAPDPRKLVLEITETAIIEDPRRALEVVTLLADLGVRISIDDFGTGYSSLEYLKRLPATELKIDRSFVMSMVASEGDAVIVRSTIDLAHNLGLQAVAEGVDSPEVWSQLRALGCDLGQGYYFSRPLPEAKLLEWIRTSPWGIVRRLPEATERSAELASAMPPALA
jgi:diguanylate cyclase (GGDEF)-like protein/PAS domain S-box-containing protein